MTTLTIKAIRENPWNVLAQPLPQFPTELLLKFALRAAEYCTSSEYALMEEARSGNYLPAWLTTDEICPDAHEECEDRYLQALDKFNEIGALFKKIRDQSGEG